MEKVVDYHGDQPPSYARVQTLSDSGDGNWAIPEEVPTAFIYNGRNYAVMLTTPDNLVDFAVGFSLTERVINSVDDIKSVHVHQSKRGVDLRLQISPECLERLDIRQRRRNMVGRAGCGVCGIENADVFFQKLPQVADLPVTLAQSVLKRALTEFSQHQTLNAITKTVHCAAWAHPSGEILRAREDVGRHNALDKLLGSRALDEDLLADGFVLMSSRCSYEIIEKAARCGVKSVASISAPTAFAIRKAEEANLSLYCLSQGVFLRMGKLEAP